MQGKEDVRSKSLGTIVGMGPDGGFRLTEVGREVIMGALRPVVVSEPAFRLEAGLIHLRRTAV